MSAQFPGGTLAIPDKGSLFTALPRHMEACGEACTSESRPISPTPHSRTRIGTVAAGNRARKPHERRGGRLFSGPREAEGAVYVHCLEASTFLPGNENSGKKRIEPLLMTPRTSFGQTCYPPEIAPFPSKRHLHPPMIAREIVRYQNLRNL